MHAVVSWLAPFWTRLKGHLQTCPTFFMTPHHHRLEIGVFIIYHVAISFVATRAMGLTVVQPAAEAGGDGGDIRVE